MDVCRLFKSGNIVDLSFICIDNLEEYFSNTEGKNTNSDRLSKNKKRDRKCA